MVGFLKSSLCCIAGMNWSLNKHGARNRTDGRNNYYDVSSTTATGGILLEHPSSPFEQCDWTIIVQLPVKGKVH